MADASSREQKVKPLKDEGTRTQVVIAGGVAGLVSRFCISPLDVVKIRLQLQTHPRHVAPPTTASSAAASNKQPYKTTYGAFKTILLEEGITAFWKGNIPAEALYITYGALQFSTYRLCTSFLDTYIPTSPSTSVFLSGAVAGASATTLTYPLDLLRTRFAAQGRTRVYTSIIHSIRDISAREGPRGFFQGLGAAIGQIVPYMGLFFVSYEALKPPLAALNLPLPMNTSDAMAGMLASVGAKTVVFPLDTIRKRLQVQGPTRSLYVNPKLPVYSAGVAKAVQSVLQVEGLRGLYRGLPVSLVKAAPASAVTMWTYERVLGLLKDLDIA